jgi:hypothetical protein
MSGYRGGHWGTTFGEQSAQQSELVRAYTVPELLDSVGWPSLDYLKCDIEGAEFELFSAPEAPDWIERVSIATVETHDRFRPGATAAVESAFPLSAFERQRSSEFHVYKRILAGRGVPDAEEATRIELFPNDGALLLFELHGVPQQEWGFTIVDQDTFQLHPSPPGNGRSEISFPLELRGQHEFSAYCHLAGGSHAVVFTARLVIDGRDVAQKDWLIQPGGREKISFALPVYVGACKLVLGTEMAPGSKNNGRAWARWQHAAVQ